MERKSRQANTLAAQSDLTFSVVPVMRSYIRDFDLNSGP